VEWWYRFEEIVKFCLNRQMTPLPS
jgi:hypothetical protein